MTARCRCMKGSIAACVRGCFVHMCSHSHGLDSALHVPIRSRVVEHLLYLSLGRWLEGLDELSILVLVADEGLPFVSRCSRADLAGANLVQAALVDLVYRVVSEALHNAKALTRQDVQRQAPHFGDVGPKGTVDSAAFDAHQDTQVDAAPVRPWPIAVHTEPVAVHQGLHQLKVRGAGARESSIGLVIVAFLCGYRVGLCTFG
mmetsp:Transcript_1356/g.5822  ORF Transcript_1356/g.5822 Transcript_1356/m.5822 type:complete len:203 (-) Transcript_1356:2389-2997(-)